MSDVKLSGLFLSAPSDMECAQTANAGFAWHCWRCDMSEYNLYTAGHMREAAERHAASDLHKNRWDQPATAQQAGTQ